MPSPVRLGSDVLLCSNRLTGARVGVVCNHASIDRGFRSRHRPGGDVVRASRWRRFSARSTVFAPTCRTTWSRRRTVTMRGGACRCIRSTARRASQRLRCCAASTRWSSTCRISAPASTPISTRWPIACGRRRGTVCRSSSATGRIRSAARPSKAPGSSRDGNRSSASFRSRCVTG